MSAVSNPKLILNTLFISGKRAYGQNTRYISGCNNIGDIVLSFNSLIYVKYLELYMLLVTEIVKCSSAVD